MVNASIESYLQSVPKAFKTAFDQIRATILANLPLGYVEAPSYGMLGYVVLLSTYPQGYLNRRDEPLPLMNLGYQKKHIALYHYGIYADEGLYNWFIQTYAAYTYPHKINLGKSCIRFQYMDEVPYDLIAELSTKLPVEVWIDRYELGTKRK